MIWWFLAGFVAGAVGWNMFCRWIGHKIIRKAQMEAFKRDGKQ